MSLLDTAMQRCVMLDRSTAPDGSGGIMVSWRDGAEFDASIGFDTTMQARMAEAQGVKSLYTVITKKNVVLKYHDVFRSKETGKILRVTSDGDDKATPPTSSLNIRQVNAEEWELA